MPIVPDANEKRKVFFQLLFGEAEGYVCLSYATPEKKFREEFFKYPLELDLMLDRIDAVTVGHNVWFCPQLLLEKRRIKEMVITTTAAWADLDTCPPELMLVPPTIVMESSPNRYQALWCFERTVDPDDAEDLSKRIAYKHADQGADRSGWDLTQLLRVPYTYNYKYNSTPTVTVITANKNLYRIDDFDSYPLSMGYEYIESPLPDELPAMEADDIMAAYHGELNGYAWTLFNNTPTVKSWSEPLWQLELLLAESGMSMEEAYVVARDSACNKYKRDGRPDADKLLWKEVNRAFARNATNVSALVPTSETVVLVSDDEREEMDNSEDTFIERYIAWARSLGDAAPQYHQAGAFMALSCLLAGSIRLPTSYGVIVPNLWFMILADTTLTRKTTAMDIAMDMVMEIDPDVMLATDGSIEGLMTTLAGRPGKPSVFLRDEFSGLLEQMTKKDYMAGMAETFTKLYDGKLQKRILRKEVIEVREPCLIIFAGGIKNKMTSLMTTEHVSSGFMPRFVFITAESDISRLRPLGPPTEANLGNRDAIKAELFDVVKHYKTLTTLEIKEKNLHVEMPTKWDVTLSAEAWKRYNQLEEDLLKAGVGSDKPEIMTPTYDRLAKSILKAAILLSAARQRNQTVVVEAGDIVRAAYYGEQWRVFVEEVVSAVGQSQDEKRLGLIFNAIRRKPGVPRSVLMRNYHLSAREADSIFTTLIQRGMIRPTKVGKTETYTSTTIVIGEDKK